MVIATRHSSPASEKDEAKITSPEEEDKTILRSGPYMKQHKAQASKQTTAGQAGNPDTALPGWENVQEGQGGRPHITAHENRSCLRVRLVSKWNSGL